GAGTPSAWRARAGTRGAGRRRSPRPARRAPPPARARPPGAAAPAPGWCASRAAPRARCRSGSAAARRCRPRRSRPPGSPGPGRHGAVRADEAKEGGAAKARRPRRGGEDVAQLVERDPVEERRVLLLHGRDQPDGPGEPEAPALDGPEARALQRGEQAHVALEPLL